MDDHSEPRWRIGQVSARTGLTTRSLRYYEELGLLGPSERLASGHRVYASADLRRLYRVSLLRQLGLPLSDIAGELDDSAHDLSDTIGRHIGQLDQRLAALGRHRERMITIRESAAAGNPTDEELLDILHEMAEVDHGLAQRLTLLVYDDIEAVHDHLVAVFGFGPGTIMIEAVPEKMEIKKAVYGELDEATPGHAILASNTSSLSITEMGRETLRPDKVVGMHFFWPASVMPLVEVISGEDTSRETVTAAFNFAQAIRKQPITCREVPGFVVNRILTAAAGEIWRAQEEGELSIKKVDEAITSANVLPMGPFFLADMSGLDVALHTAEYMQESYGDRFYVHEGMKKLVADGKLGAKTGGDGFYKEGEAQIAGEADADPGQLGDLLMLKSLVEACSLLEERVSTVREIDLGLMAGAGLDPRKGLFPPFWKADLEGLDTVLEKLEKFEESHGERFAPPRILKRLVAQGRLGLKSGQGFYAYPQGEGEGVVKLEKRGDVAIAWLANPPMNAISPDVIGDLGKAWEQVKADDEIRAMVVYSSLPVVYSAGADIKAFSKMDDPEKGAELINNGHALLRELGQSSVSTVAAVNAIAYGGGCELAMACDFRVAAESAVFGQPEINLGIIPGFGGTQRLARLVGPSKALELNLTGDAVLAREARDWGLADDLVPDEELLDVALGWARKLAQQAPLAVEQVKLVSHKGDLDEGIEAEKQGFAKAFLSEDGREGISAFLQKRKAKWQGK